MSALPDPSTGFSIERCLGCGYPLEGMPAGSVCPECGTPIPGPDDVVILSGVARITETSRGRRWAWIVICIGGFVYAQVLPILVFSKPVYTGLIFAILLFSILGLLLTGRSHKRGKERFVFTPHGWGRSTIDTEDVNEFTPWDGRVHARWKRISSVWYRLRVDTFDEQGKRRSLLDAGVRCPDADIEWLAPALETLSAGGELEASSGDIHPAGLGE